MIRRSLRDIVIMASPFLLSQEFLVDDRKSQIYDENREGDSGPESDGESLNAGCREKDRHGLRCVHRFPFAHLPLFRSDQKNLLAARKGVSIIK
jgi:hypothetical protein